MLNKQTNTEKFNLVALYDRIYHKKFKLVNIFDVYESIKTSYQEETLTIQKRHASDILSKFSKVSKDKGYNPDRKKYLQAVVFAGSIDRRIKTNSFIHSGRINVDIDENSKEELESFLQVIKSGRIKFIEAAAKSVSGALSGSFWVNIKADIPSKFSYIPSELVKILHLTKDNFQAELHTSFYKMFADMLNKEGIKAGKTSDYKRSRYLSHDTDIYVNTKADRLKLDNLLAYLKEKKTAQSESIETLEKATFNINESDAFKFAEQYAKQKTYYSEDFHSGHYTSGLHNYIYYLSVSLNCLGIPEKEAKTYIQSVYPSYLQTGRDGIKYPYSRYKDNFGIWQHKLKIEVADSYSLEVAAGKKLSNYKDQLVGFYAAEHSTEGQTLFDISAGTSIGKTYNFVNCMPSDLKTLNGCKTVIVFPLNSKTEKDAAQYKLPYITGEVLNKLGSSKIWLQAEQSDVILTNQHTFPKVAERLSEGRHSLNIVLDESHTFPNGMSEGYKAAEMLEFWESAKYYGKTVTLLSGTTKDYFTQIGFKRITVKQEDRPSINLTIQTTDSKPDLTILTYVSKFNFSKGQKLMIKIQSKKAIQIIKKMLLQSKKFTDKDIICLYSDPNVKKSKHYRKLINSGSADDSFDETVKIILCTSFINEGIDIYSKADIITVSVLKTATIDIDDEVQFFDRHRSNKSKEAVLFVPIDKAADKIERLELRVKSLEAAPDDNVEKIEALKERLHTEKLKQKRLTEPFNHLHYFNELLQSWTVQAELLNQVKTTKNRFYSDDLNFQLKTQFSDNSKFLFYDEVEQKIKVNELYVMKETEVIKRASTSLEKAKAEIKERFSYIIINDGSVQPLQSDQNEDLDILIKKVKADELTVIKNVQKELKQILTNDKEILIQAVVKHSDDVGLKRRAKQRFKEDDKQKVIFLEKDFQHIQQIQHIFNDHFEQAEKLVKRVMTLESKFLPDADILKVLFNDDDDSFVSAEGFSSFIEKYNCLLSDKLLKMTAEDISVEKDSKLLTRLQIEDAKLVYKAKNILSDVKITKGEKVRSIDVFEALKGVFKKGITQKKAVRLMNILFVTDRSNGLYLIKADRNFEDFLQEEGLSDSVILNQINKILCR